MMSLDSPQKYSDDKSPFSAWHTPIARVSNSGYDYLSVVIGQHRARCVPNELVFGGSDSLIVDRDCSFLLLVLRNNHQV